MASNDKLSRASKILLEAQFYLGDLSRAFDATGNERMAVELRALAESIAEASKLASDAYVEELKDRLGAAQGQVGMTLKALLEKAT